MHLYHGINQYITAINMVWVIRDAPPNLSWFIHVIKNIMHSELEMFDKTQDKAFCIQYKSNTANSGQVKRLFYFMKNIADKQALFFIVGTRCLLYSFCHEHFLRL